MTASSQPNPAVTPWGSGGYLGFVQPDFAEGQALVVQWWDGTAFHHDLVYATTDEQYIGPAIEWAEIVQWQEVRI